MILEVRGLKKSFRHPWNLKQIQVLKGLSFQIEKPGIVGFLGGNGAGKTTTMKCLLGLLQFDEGFVQIMGKETKNLEIRNRIGYLPERPDFYRYLSSEEFLRFYGQLSTSLSKKDLDRRIDGLLELVGLSHAKKYLLRQFSKGMLQRIGMAQALIHNPEILILDEPLSGLDPDGRMQMAEVIKTAAAQGTTIFFSSHLLDDVDKICEDLVVLRNGEIAFTGRKNDFLRSGETSYRLRFELEGTVFEESAADLKAAQDRIDSIRTQDGKILQFDSHTLSLEDAYKQFHR